MPLDGFKRRNYLHNRHASHTRGPRPDQAGAAAEPVAAGSHGPNARMNCETTLARLLIRPNQPHSQPAAALKPAAPCAATTATHAAASRVTHHGAESGGGDDGKNTESKREAQAFSSCKGKKTEALAEHCAQHCCQLATKNGGLPPRQHCRRAAAAPPLAQPRPCRPRLAARCAARR